MLSTPKAIAKALNIPPRAKILLRSDSTLTHYPIADRATYGDDKMRGKTISIMHKLNEKFYYQFEHDVWSGATL